MQYVITDTSTIQISETSGTIQNISSSAVELSNSADFEDSFVLYPLNQCRFTEQLYIRVYGGFSQIVQVNVAPFVSSGGVGGDSAAVEYETDSEVAAYLDSIFPVGSETATVKGSVLSLEYARDEEVKNYLEAAFGR